MAALHPASAHPTRVPPDVLLPPEQHGHITAAVMRLQILQPAVIKALGTSIQGLDALAARHGQRWALGLAEQASDFRDHACTLASLATVAARRAHFVAGTDLEETAMPAAQPAQPSTTSLSALTVTGAGAATMTSREIAELTEKEHKHVLRDIRVMLAELGLPEMGYAQVWTDPQNGQSYPMLALPKDLTITLVAGYKVKLRHRIITRWQELEAQAAQPVVPQTLAQALRLAADQADALAATQAQLAIAAPKAQALDRLATGTDGSLCLTDAAKAMQMMPKRFTAWLQELRWIHRRPMGSGWLAYQDRITVGQLEHKITEGTRPDGSTWMCTQVRVTAKGMKRLAELAQQGRPH